MSWITNNKPLWNLTSLQSFPGKCYFFMSIFSLTTIQQNVISYFIFCLCFTPFCLAHLPKDVVKFPWNALVFFFFCLTTTQKIYFNTKHRSPVKYLFSYFWQAKRDSLTWLQKIFKCHVCYMFDMQVKHRRKTPGKIRMQFFFKY